MYEMLAEINYKRVSSSIYLNIDTSPFMPDRGLRCCVSNRKLSKEGTVSSAS
jgi:hypothetical protein